MAGCPNVWLRVAMNGETIEETTKQSPAVAAADAAFPAQIPRAADTRVPLLREREVSAQWPRRIISIPTALVVALISLVWSPILLAVAALFDLARWLRSRRTPMATRLVAFFLAYAGAQLLGLFALLLTWLEYQVRRNYEVFQARNERLMAAWLGGLLGIARGLFRLQLEIDNEGVLAEGARFVMFPRHASILDVLVPFWIVSRTRTPRLRYVLKNQLRWDPCLDIAGTRLGCVFVERGRKAANVRRRERSALDHAARSLGRQQAVVIFPEGTRFSAKRQAASLSTLASKNPDRYERCRSLRHVLPPRVIGPLALLASRPDVVFCAHVGFEGASHVIDLLDGQLVGRSIKAHLWRVPGASVPDSESEMVAWLDRQWQTVDDWIDARFDVGAAL